jgi:hypothetical protein
MARSNTDRKVTITVALPLSIMTKLDEESYSTGESISNIVGKRVRESLTRSNASR